MQPVQYVSQHPVTNLHLSTHVATSDDDNQAAIPMQSATTASKKRIEPRTQEQALLQNT